MVYGRGTQTAMRPTEYALAGASSTSAPSRTRRTRSTAATGKRRRSSRSTPTCPSCRLQFHDIIVWAAIKLMSGIEGAFADRAVALGGIYLDVPPARRRADPPVDMGAAARLMPSGLDRNIAVTSPTRSAGARPDQHVASPSRRARDRGHELRAGGHRLRPGDRPRAHRRAAAERDQLLHSGFDAGTVAIVAGDTITGQTSGRPASCWSRPTASPARGAAANAAGTLVLVAVTGTFLDNEVLRVAGVAHAKATARSSENVGPTARPRGHLGGAAQTYMRNLIMDVPGSGPVRGGFVLQRHRLCRPRQCRSDAGRLFKATAAGWVQQTFGRLLRFNLGLVEIAEGAHHRRDLGRDRACRAGHRQGRRVGRGARRPTRRRQPHHLGPGRQLHDRRDAQGRRALQLGDQCQRRGLESDHAAFWRALRLQGQEFLRRHQPQARLWRQRRRHRLRV
jgi:hypothetical protein